MKTNKEIIQDLLVLLEERPEPEFKLVLTPLQYEAIRGMGFDMSSMIVGNLFSDYQEFFCKEDRLDRVKKYLEEDPLSSVNYLKYTKEAK